MNSKTSTTKKLVLNGALAAILIIFGLTPIGYIPIGAIQITLLCLPVAIGTLTLGLKSGFFLGFIFGATSLYQLLTAPNPLAIALMSDPMFWVKMSLIIFIPRLLIPATTYFAYIALSRNDKHKYLPLAVSSVVASLTNTVFFLGMLLILFTNMPVINLAFAGTTVLTNALPEVLFMGIVCPPIVKALRHVNI